MRPRKRGFLVRWEHRVNASDVVVTGHQPNLLPGLSVVSKIGAADIFVVCDEMQYVRHGWVNRNVLADGTWLTIPVNEHDTFAPINRVRLAESPARWREKLARTLEHKLGFLAEGFAADCRRPWRLLAGLNVALLRRLLDELELTPEWAFQSHLDAGRHYGPMVTEDVDDLVNISERLALITAELGGTVWLSGPSGRNYLDESPFLERDLKVEYWSHDGPNHSALELIRDRVAA